MDPIRVQAECSLSCTGALLLLKAAWFAVHLELKRWSMRRHLTRSEGRGLLTNVGIAPGAGTAVHDSSPFLWAVAGSEENSGV